MANTTGEIKLTLKAPSRRRMLVGSVIIAIGGMIMNVGNSLLYNGFKVEDK